MHTYPRSVMVLCLLLACSACSSNDLFSKQWRVVKITDAKSNYCQSGGDHLDVDDKIKTSRFLFWKSVMAVRSDSSKDWKLKGIRFDRSSGDTFGKVLINHEECFRLHPLMIDGSMAVQIFLKSTGGEKCDGQLIDTSFMNGVLNGNCPAAHSGGWLAQ